MGPLAKMESNGGREQNGAEASDELSLGLVEIEVSAENPNRKYSKELDIQVEPGENSGLEIGIS